MKRFLLAVICVAFLVGLLGAVGCETVNGMGKDINNTGKAIFGPRDTSTPDDASGSK